MIFLQQELPLQQLDCEDRSGAIPGYPSYDGVFGDQSNTIRTVEYSIPAAYQNQANVNIRFVVDTDLTLIMVVLIQLIHKKDLHLKIFELLMIQELYYSEMI